jgi:ABC-type phosphate transport system substrate-binding protein
LSSGYNIPQLGSNRLVLNCETLAAIYQNKITMWNDTHIKKINSPAVAALLPAQPIVVVVLTESSAVTQLFTYMLNATVRSFAAEVPHHQGQPTFDLRRVLQTLTGASCVSQVGAGGQVYFPVQGAFNRSLNASSGEELVSLLRSTQYSIAVWMHQPLLLVPLSSVSL